MVLAEGVAGQLKGPFSANTNLVQLITNNAKKSIKMQFGIQIGEKDWMRYTPDKTFTFIVNDEVIRMGRTQMYETGAPIEVNYLAFEEAAPPSTMIDYILAEQ